MNARVAIPERPAAAEIRISPDEAMRRTEGFLSRNVGHLLAAGTPHRILFPLRSGWVVPVQLTYPGYGTVGQVGTVVVDEATGDVIAWSSPDEMYQATEKLYREHQAEIEEEVKRCHRQ